MLFLVNAMADKNTSSVIATSGVNIFAMVGEILSTNCGLFRTMKVARMGMVDSPHITT